MSFPEIPSEVVISGKKITIPASLVTKLLSDDPIRFSDIRNLFLLWLMAPSAGVKPGSPTPNPPTDPPEPILVYPNEVIIEGIELTHPRHPEGPIPCHIERGENGAPDRLVLDGDTTSLDDGAHMYVHLSYLKDGVPIHFDNTPNAGHLKHTSILTVRQGGREGTISRALVTGGGIIADGGQIVAEYNRTEGMDIKVKLVPADKGGIGGGRTATVSVSAPNSSSSRVIRHLELPPIR